MKKFNSIALCFLFSVIAGMPNVYGGELITDSVVRDRPSLPPLFGADHKAVDPTFYTTILRVTGPSGSNAVRESAETQNLSPIQHFHNPWNVTGDLFIVWEDRLSQGVGGGTTVYSFNSTDFSVSRVNRLGASAASQVNYNRGIKWSTNPSLSNSDNKYLLYAVDSSATPNTIKRWNVDLTSAHDGLAAGSSEVILTDVDGISQLTVSSDCDKFNYWTSANVVKVYVKSTNTTYSKDCSSWYSFDECEIVDSGSYVEVKGHQVNGDQIKWIYNYQLTTEYAYNQYAPDFMAGKTSSKGNLIVNEDSQHSTYQLVVRDLSIDSPGESPWSGGSPKNIFVGPTKTTGSVHPAMSSAQYVYGGFFRSTGHPTPWVAYHDEVVRITVQDASANGNQVLRLCHAWSNFYNNSYDEIPTYASPDGKYVLFYSNWNGSSSTARHDVFIVSTFIFSPTPSIKNIAIH